MSLVLLITQQQLLKKVDVIERVCLRKLPLCYYL